MSRQGKIVAPANLNIYDHELKAARAIADAGIDVEFVPRTLGKRAKSADFVAGGVLWEIKSPTSSNLRVVEKHLRDAVHQSRDVIFDCRRMQIRNDLLIQKEAEKWSKNLTYLRRLLFINKSGEVVKLK